MRLRHGQAGLSLTPFIRYGRERYALVQVAMRKTRKVSVRIPCALGELARSRRFRRGRLDCAHAPDLAVEIPENEITRLQSHHVPVMGESGTLLVGGGGPQISSGPLLPVRGAFVDPPDTGDFGLTSEERKNLRCTALLEDVESLKVVLGFIAGGTV